MEGTAELALGVAIALIVAGAIWLASRVHRGVTADLGEDIGKDFVRRNELIKAILSEEVFAKRSELNAWGDRVNAFGDVLATTRERGDSNADSIIRLQEADRHRWEPVAAMLKRLDARLDSHEKAITRTVAVLDSLEKRMDRHEHNGRE